MAAEQERRDKEIEEKVRQKMAQQKKERQDL